MTNKARIVFAGSPDFAVPTLETLLRSQHEVVAVLTQPDRPAGRGRELRAGPVKLAADEAGIPVLQPESLDETGVKNELLRLEPDLMVVVAYGLLLPSAVLALPRAGCVNLHASLLPRWRGASPVQMALLDGDKETGVCLMQMEEGLDTGPVYAETRLEIGPTETAGELHDRLATLAAELLAASLEGILDGTIEARPQAEEGASYAARIYKSDGVIDWNRSAVEIDRQIRAFNPWPVAQTRLHGEPLRCWQAMLSGAAGTSVPGAVLSATPAGITVQTGEGSLLLTRVQEPGRNRVAAGEFARARDLVNVVLGE
ncbi:MAG: methionyl-tRNA formyltransferase [Gammaproteobacteria bacterium]|jgi:methionyl-tRNA formyltransferase|nr:methionyl-tRNA formyltransferase [Gammaproteobacteria bacterium]MDP6617533.1 methionyl-tRNA formyltransferase [Gammaproteobacteria bacterium]MDP6694410.1 methionyl-tRNA formyltransferase [Gammaproteobacteria bacterium]